MGGLYGASQETELFVEALFGGTPYDMIITPSAPTEHTIPNTASLQNIAYDGSSIWNIASNGNTEATVYEIDPSDASTLSSFTFPSTPVGRRDGSYDHDSVEVGGLCWDPVNSWLWASRVQKTAGNSNISGTIELVAVNTSGVEQDYMAYDQGDDITVRSLATDGTYLYVVDEDYFEVRKFAISSGASIDRGDEVGTWGLLDFFQNGSVFFHLYHEADDVWWGSSGFDSQLVEQGSLAFESITKWSWDGLGAPRIIDKWYVGGDSGNPREAIPVGSDIWTLDRSDERYYVFSSATSWVDITSDVREISLNRGRQFELDRFEAGTASIFLDNSSGDYTPSNTAGTHYPLVKPSVPVRITAVHNSITYYLWFGFVESWRLEFPEQVDSAVMMECVDFFKILALEQQSNDSFSSKITGLSPVAYWRFSATSGSNIPDVSGDATNHDLTLNGTFTLDEDGAWDLDVASGFDGSTAYATSANQGDFELEQNMSIVILFKPHDASGAKQTLVSMRDSGGPLFDIIYDPDDSEIEVYPANTDGSAFKFFTGDITTHDLLVAFAFDWATGRVVRGVYADLDLSSGVNTGYEAHSASYQPNVTSATFNIGRRAVANDLYFDGFISEVAIFDVAFTQAQLLSFVGPSLRTDGQAEQTTDDRIRNYLEDSGFFNHALEAGQTTMAAEGPRAESVLDAIQRAETTESGQVFVSGDGNVTFHDRYFRSIVKSAPSATFGPGGGELPVFQMVPSLDDALIWNQVQVSLDDLTAEVVDSDSRDLHGPRTLQVDSYPADTNELADLAQTLLGRYADPSLRVDEIEIRMGGDPALWPVVLGAEISDRFTAKKTMTGDDLDMEVVLEAISMDIRADKTWTVEWQLSPGFTTTYWVLGDSDQSLLGQTTILGY